MLSILIGLVSGVVGGNLTKFIADGKFSLGQQKNSIYGGVVGAISGLIYMGNALSVGGLINQVIQGLAIGLAIVVVAKVIMDRRKTD